MQQLICIMCPNGCLLTVDNGNITGNKCKKGIEYGIQETTAPVRVLTATMKAEGCTKPFAVKSAGFVPKAMVRACAAELANHHPQLPIRIGDVVVENILGLGVNIVATQDFMSE